MAEMNRRDALKSALGVVSAIGIDGEVSTISISKPKAFLLMSPKSISDDAEKRLKRQWSEVFTGTPYASIPVIILEDGLQLSVIDDPSANVD